MSYRIKDETYLTAAETANEIGRATQTVYQHWKTWGWKPYRFGQTLLFKKSQVYTWLESQIIEDDSFIPDRLTINQWIKLQFDKGISVRLINVLINPMQDYIYIDELTDNVFRKFKNCGIVTFNEFKKLRNIDP